MIMDKLILNYFVKNNFVRFKFKQGAKQSLHTDQKLTRIENFFRVRF
jgi:hypothetical protein